MELQNEKIWLTISVHTKTGNVIVDEDANTQRVACEFCKDKNTCDKKGLKPCWIPCG